MASDKAPIVEINVGQNNNSVPRGMENASPREMLTFMLAARAFDVMCLTVKWVGIAYVASQLAKASTALAGKTTEAGFLLELLGSRSGESRFVWVYPTVTAIGICWALIERVLRYRKVKYLAGRVSNLERIIDANRTSSGLAETGATHPRDE